MSATIVISGKIYARLTRKQAENLYNDGITITLYPSKYNGGYYQNLNAYHINKNIGEPYAGFPEMVDWYNLTFCDAESGKAT